MAKLLEVDNLRVQFRTDRGNVNAVNGVSFSLEPGETLGIVGESGSGKSVTSLAVMGLLASPPAVVTADKIHFDGADLLSVSREQLRKLRGNRISMIFQDPMTSLNPFLRVSRQLTEVLEIHQGLGRKEALRKVIEMLERVGIPGAGSRVHAYPHEFSGGMRQRVMIAMSLLCEPEVLIADEPTTALDVTIQAQILELLKELQEERGMAIVLITHDLGVVAGSAETVMVMYGGRVMERAGIRELFADPRHPYTRGLLRSVPRLDDLGGSELYSIPGRPPIITDLLQGCPFADRCDSVQDRCRAEVPPARDLGGRDVRCFVDTTTGRAWESA
ncbi:MAG: oligopeptide transport system ATP-binding protein [Myxococcota bacterium]|jgi:oligopeptide transport system ATP-binding protein